MTRYRLLSGQTIPGMHADDVREALGVYRSYTEGIVADFGTLSHEDGMARALEMYRHLTERRRMGDHEDAEEYDRQMRAMDTHSSDVDPGTGRE